GRRGIPHQSRRATGDRLLPVRGGQDSRLSWRSGPRDRALLTPGWRACPRNYFALTFSRFILDNPRDDRPVAAAHLLSKERVMNPTNFGTHSATHHHHGPHTADIQTLLDQVADSPSKRYHVLLTLLGEAACRQLGIV